MLFHQIYAELNALNTKYANVEQMLVENYEIALENKKREESLNGRIDVLEEENNELIKELNGVIAKLVNTERQVELCKENNNELIYNHNSMITKINSIVLELNDVITVLNNKYEENYYFLRVLCKKEF